MQRVLASGWFLMGPELEAFEAEFAAYLGIKQVAGVASGTDAVTLALRACGVVPGDWVLTPSHTAVATVAAIELAGAVPVYVDIEPDTFNISARTLSAALASMPAGGGARAIVVVHLYGRPVDMPAVLDVAKAHGLRVIEDCAQSHGATWNGKWTGTFGDAACFSFYPTKNLAALGDGGAVATHDDEVAERVRMLRQYGWKERFISSVPGVNSRLDELQAAILRVRLRHLDDENGRRRELAAVYDRHLAHSTVIRPSLVEGAVYHQYVIRDSRRDELAATLRTGGIGTSVHYPVPVHDQPAYCGRAVIPSSLVETESAAREVLSLPMHPWLGSEELNRICEAVVLARPLNS
jgi:dTDP-4-amino-4,6-dideoxygalactose transaminase